jgi:hypothetical protein
MTDAHLHWDETHLTSTDPSEWDLRPELFSHLDSLYLRCTQTSLPDVAQRKLVKAWCEIIPTLNVTSLTLATRTNQQLVNAACQLSNLEFLRIGWGGAKTLAPIANCRRLTSLEIGSSPSLEGLSVLKSLKHLRKLKIENVKEAQDLSFVSGIGTLTDLGICGSMWTDQKVDTLRPVAKLHGLETLHLIATRILHDGLTPLHGMPNLKELNASFYYSASDFAALRSATPSLKSGTPFDSNGIETWCKA